MYIYFSDRENNVIAKKKNRFWYFNESLRFEVLGVWKSSSFKKRRVYSALCDGCWRIKYKRNQDEILDMRQD